MAAALYGSNRARGEPRNKSWAGQCGEAVNTTNVKWESGLLTGLGHYGCV
jgi:hypothetical protein